MRRSRTPRTGILLAATALALVAALPAGIATAAAPVTSPRTPAPVSQPIVPAPVASQPGAGRFTLQPHSRIVVTQSSARAVAAGLRSDLRPATGYLLPVVAGRTRPGDVTLQLGAVAGLTVAQQAEGYRLQ